MNKLKLTLISISIAIALTACSGCEEPCDRNPTYRKEVGVGYVFAYDSEGVLHPVEGANITVENKKWTPGMFGSNFSVGKEHFYTDAEGRYQVRFVEKGCFENSNGRKEMVYCNTYHFIYNGKNIYGIGYTMEAQNNVKIIDTIKIK